MLPAVERMQRVFRQKCWQLVRPADDVITQRQHHAPGSQHARHLLAEGPKVRGMVEDLAGNHQLRRAVLQRQAFANPAAHVDRDARFRRQPCNSTGSDQFRPLSVEVRT